MLGLDSEKKRINQDEISDEIFGLVHPHLQMKLSDIIKKNMPLQEIKKLLIGLEGSNNTKLFRNFL